MANDIRINVVTTQDGAQIVPQTADELTQLGQAGEKASGGLNSFVQGAADAYGAVNILMGSMKQAGGMVQMFYDAGVASERFTAGLNALSGGKADQYIKSMSDATHGLIDNTTLARDASLALSTGIAKSSAEAANLARIGATLGVTFQNDAAGGVNAFFTALERPGNTRPLAQLGYDIAAVKTEFEDLKKSGMELGDAWQKTLIDQSPAKNLGDALDGAGTAMDRLNARMKDFVAYNGTRIAIGIDATLNLADALGRKIATDIALGSDGHIVTGAEAPAFNAQYSSIVQQTNKAAAEDQMRKQLQQAAAADQAQDMMVGALAPTASSARNREALLDASSNTSFTSNEASARGNARGGYSVANAYNPQSDRMALMADAAQRTQAAMDAAANRTGTMDVYAQHIADAFQKVNNTSIAQAFGLTGGGIGGEIGGGLSGAAVAERSNMVKHGATKGQLDQFDAQTKQAIDQYKISTGQATPESIAFADAQAKVYQLASVGKITMKEAATEVKGLADAMAAGKTSFADLDKLTIGGIANAGGSAAPDLFRDRGTGDGKGASSSAKSNASSLYDPYIQGAQKAQDANTAVGTTATAAATVTVAATSRMTAGLLQATGAAIALAAAMALTGGRAGGK